MQPELEFGRKELLKLSGQAQNSYVDDLSKIVLAFEKDESFLSSFLSKQFGGVYPFLSYSGEGGIISELMVNQISGFPEESEISSVITPRREVFPFPITPENIEGNALEYAHRVADQLARGELATSDQSAYRMLEHYQRIFSASEQGKFPKIREIRQIQNHSSENDKSVSILVVDYNSIQDQPRYWRIDLEDCVEANGTGLQKLTNLAARLGRRQTKKPIVSDDPRERDKDFDPLVLSALFFNSSTMRAALETRYPHTVSSVTNLSVGPFYHPAIGNYTVFSDANPKMPALTELQNQFGAELYILAICRDEATERGSQQSVRFRASHPDLERQLNALNFPTLGFKVPYIIVNGGSG